MATIGYEAPTVALTTYLTTTLNALANLTTDLGAEINNETDLCMFMDLELRLSSIDLSAQTNPNVEVYLIESLDAGSTYETAGEDGQTLAIEIPSASKICCILSPRKSAGAEAKVVVQSLIPIPPGRFKLLPRNMLGVAFSADTNTLDYRTYNLESA